ncbi:Coiled-coil domain-containing protein 121 [Myotis brandtii]|uniref:Coiled-coil domain-containing protein 121 n=1 Tax=Myotis brandtii TaxID=109478 RepID=S7Q7S2_MYOBR|nr:Coiled-coil domain-containing protein 121 [Myotis brandtii]
MGAWLKERTDHQGAAPVLSVCPLVELNQSQAETAAKAQAIKAQFAQEKALLKKQLSEPVGKERKDLKRKAQALEVAAKKRTSEFSHSFCRENSHHRRNNCSSLGNAIELQAAQSLLKKIRSSPGQCGSVDAQLLSYTSRASESLFRGRCQSSLRKGGNASSQSHTTQFVLDSA